MGGGLRALVIVARDTSNPARAGGDRHVCLLAEYLATRGFSVDLLCASYPSLPHIEIRSGVRIIRAAPLWVFAPVVWVRLLIGGSRQYCLVVEEMIGGARMPFLAPILSRARMAGFWYQDNTEIFAAHYGRLLRILAGYVQRFVIRIHSGGFIVCPSEGSRQWLLTRGYAPSQVAVFYPSADPEGFANPAPTFRQRANRLVTIGNIRPMKRFEEAIDITARVRKAVPDVELVIVGRPDDPEYLHALRSMSERPEVRGHVRFEVGISERRKYEVLSSSKVLLVNSAIEGLGLTIFEAGLSRVPSVVNSGVPADAICDGVTGVRVASTGPTGFLYPVQSLLTDEARWNELSEGAWNASLPFRKYRADSQLEGLVSNLIAASVVRK